MSDNIVSPGVIDSETSRETCTLLPYGKRARESRDADPGVSSDLHLDRIVSDIVGADEYGLTEWFQQPLTDPAGITARQDVFRDLEDGTLREGLEEFATLMRRTRQQQAQAEKLRSEYQRKRWILDATCSYIDAVGVLEKCLRTASLTSEALGRYRDRISEYCNARPFANLVTESQRVITALSTVEYTVEIRNEHVTVARYEGEGDYSATVRDTFERFALTAAKDHHSKFSDSVEMNHVEAQVLAFVAQLFPEEFGLLDRFADAHPDAVDESIARFDREAQFYLHYLAYIRLLRSAGLAFCYPDVGADRRIQADDTFDLALATTLVDDDAPVVTNSFFLDEGERVIVVSGPNQGGKTTFARTFGQLHHLAALGCPVPGTRVRLFVPDAIYTQFERDEDISGAGGKLEDDLMRIQRILSQVTPNSVLICNEVFTSTTLHDAEFLGERVLHRVIELGMYCVYVTFIDELSRLDPSVVSMVSTVDPDDHATRTLKIERQEANGLAYALAIAQRHELDYPHLIKRLTRNTEPASEGEESQ